MSQQYSLRVQVLKRVLDSVERLKVLLAGNGLKYPPRKRVFQNNTLYHAMPL